MNTFKMMSQLHCVAGPVSAKNFCILLTVCPSFSLNLNSQICNKFCVPQWIKYKMFVLPCWYFARLLAKQPPIIVNGTKCSYTLAMIMVTLNCHFSNDNIKVFIIFFGGIRNSTWLLNNTMNNERAIHQMLKKCSVFFHGGVVKIPIKFHKPMSLKKFSNQIWINGACSPSWDTGMHTSTLANPPPHTTTHHSPTLTLFFFLCLPPGFLPVVGPNWAVMVASDTWRSPAV